MKVVILFIMLSVVQLELCGATLKHPQEMDLSDLDVDTELMDWTERRKVDFNCDTFYRRLVKHLFNKQRFKPDPTSNYYIASVPLRLKSEQWKLLVEHDIAGLNLNEIDDLIADVLKQSNDDDWDYPVAQILFEHYRHQLIQSLPQIDAPIILIAIAILVILVLGRIFRDHFSTLTFSAIILFLLLGICTLSYAMTYWDCMSDLEVEQMIQLSKKQSANNPCKDFGGEHTSFWSSFRATFLVSSENECLEHMRKTFKTSKKYCDPLDVFAKWVAQIQMSYLSKILGGFLELITTMTSSSNFLSKVISWIICTAAFVLLIYAFGREVIVQSFSAALNMLNRRPVEPGPRPERQRDALHEISARIDGILEENRQMRRELRTIRENSEERGRISPAGIEDIAPLPSISE